MFTERLSTKFPLSGDAHKNTKSYYLYNTGDIGGTPCMLNGSGRQSAYYYYTWFFPCTVMIFKSAPLRRR